MGLISVGWAMVWLAMDLVATLLTLYEIPAYTPAISELSCDLN